MRVGLKHHAADTASAAAAVKEAGGSGRAGRGGGGRGGGGADAGRVSLMDELCQQIAAVALRSLYARGLSL